MVSFLTADIVRLNWRAKRITCRLFSPLRKKVRFVFVWFTESMNECLCVCVLVCNSTVRSATFDFVLSRKTRERDRSEQSKHDDSGKFCRLFL